MVTRLSPDTVVGSCDGDVGAYVHVPFCAMICPFCPYNKVRAQAGLARRYFAGLGTEMAWYADALADAGFAAFTSLYIGGGTPTLYPAALACIVEALPVTGERAVEVLPTHATPRGLERLGEAGITAVSIGAQSFHDEVLARLQRPHTAAHSLDAVGAAVGRFSCVDVDLIVDVAWDDDPATAGRTLVAVGPRAYSLRELVEFTAAAAGLKRRVIGLPDWAARLQAAVMDFVPGKPFSSDNYRSLQTPNTSDDNSLPEFGIEPASIERLVPGYLRQGRHQQRLDEARRQVRH